MFDKTSSLFVMLSQKSVNALIRLCVGNLVALSKPFPEIIFLIFVWCNQTWKFRTHAHGSEKAERESFGSMFTCSVVKMREVISEMEMVDLIFFLHSSQYFYNNFACFEYIMSSVTFIYFFPIMFPFPLINLLKFFLKLVKYSLLSNIRPVPVSDRYQYPIKRLWFDY